MPPTSHNKRTEGKAKTLWFPPRGFKSQVTTVHDHQVHALVGGAKFAEKFLWLRPKQTPMLMIHGALASRRYLMPTAKLLVQHLPVYVLDLPGHGASSKPTHALSVEEHASVISQWLDGNKLRRVFVYANSYGCQIAAQLAVDRPDVMAGLVLSGSTVDPEAPTLFQQFLRLCVDSFNEPLSARVQVLIDLQEMGVGLVFETVNQMMRNDITLNLPRIRCRTLVMRGEADPISPQGWTEKLTEMIPDATCLVIANAPHCVNYTSPKELAKILLQFVGSQK